jgi:uncharacterized protein
MPSPRYIREIPARYRLEASRCTACGQVVYPGRKVCLSCGSRETETVRLSTKGTVVTSTVIHVPPDEFLNEAPYAMAVVETPEGARLMTQIVDCDPSTVLPGMMVDLEFRRVREELKSGILCYGHKGVPAGT